MKKTKRLVALLLALILTMGSIMPVHAGLFAKKLTAPTTCSGQWQGDDFYVVWDKVPSAAEYSVKVVTQTVKVNTNYVKVNVTDIMKQKGIVTGTIEVTALPGPKDGSHKASDPKVLVYKGTILQKPLKYTYYWIGDRLKVAFNSVQDAAGYELCMDGGKPFYTKDPSYLFTLGDASKKAGKVEHNLSIRAVPANADKSKRASEYAVMPISTAVPDYRNVKNMYEATLLSKDQLINYFRANGYQPQVGQTEKYTVVGVTLTDKNNGTGKKMGSILGNAAAGALKAIINNSDKIMDAENADEAKGNAKVYGALGALSGAMEGYNNAPKDSNKHISYVFNKGDEDMSAVLFSYNYLMSGNTEPDFSNLTYNKSDSRYYVGYSNFNRYLTLYYQKDGDRWQVYGEPSYYVNTGVFK